MSIDEDQKSMVTAIDRAMDSVKNWDGARVEDILPHLESARIEIRSARLTDEDSGNDLIELLNEKSKWPAAYQDQTCEFAIAADAAGKYIAWEFPDYPWWKCELRIGQFDNPEG